MDQQTRTVPGPNGRMLEVPVGATPEQVQQLITMLASEKPPDKRPTQLLDAIQADIQKQWSEPGAQDAMRRSNMWDQRRASEKAQGVTMGEGMRELIPAAGGVLGFTVGGPGGAAVGAGLGEAVREHAAGESFSPGRIGLNAATAVVPGPGLRLTGRGLKSGAEWGWKKAADTANIDSARAAMSRGMGALTRENQKKLADPATFNSVPRPPAKQIQTLQDDFAHGVQRATGDNFTRNAQDLALAGGFGGYYSPEVGLAVGGARLLTRPGNLSRIAQGAFTAGSALKQPMAPNMEQALRAYTLSLLGGK